MSSRDPNAIAAAYETDSPDPFWDTGAGLSVVDRDFVERNPGGFTFVSDVTGRDVTGTPISIKLYRMDSLEVNGVLLPESHVLAMDFAFRGDYFGPDVQMVLGLNHMTVMKWYFDLPARRWSLGEVQPR